MKPTFNGFKPSLLPTIIAITLASQAHASVVRDDIDYQYFRDFAENKGQFHIGATNVTIYDKNNNEVGVMLPNVPMIDFSSADRNNAIAVAVTPQYLTSVAHNDLYGSVSFGQVGNNTDAHSFNYQLVDRNDTPAGGSLNKDYHTPRVHKLITEITPSQMTDAGSDQTTYKDKTRFPVMIRVGSGTQYVRPKEGETNFLAKPYNYLTGGNPFSLTGTRAHWLDFKGKNIKDSEFGPMATYGTPGDSGSSIWAYDTVRQDWVLVGVFNFYVGTNGLANMASISRPDYLNEKVAEDNGVSIDNKVHNAQLTWSANGNQSTLSDKSGNAYTLDINDDSLTPQDTDKVKPSLNHGKNLDLSGYRQTITLTDNIHQGAGAIRVNAGVTIKPKNDETWQGAGIIVEKGKALDWRVKNPEGDRLSKIGEGIMTVNGTGKNLGDISVGDGTVILNQKADRKGQKQAFNSVGIVSGRPTVVLNSADQVNPDNIYFGFRGGRLDVNGNSLTFSRIKNIDEGANIINNSTTAATINIQGKHLGEDDLSWGGWKQSEKDIYTYTRKGRADEYFALRTGGWTNAYFPNNRTSNDHWEYLGLDKTAAIKTIADRKANQTYNGYFGKKDDQIITADALQWGQWRESGKDIYAYVNKHAGGRVDYFTLKSNGNPKHYFPTNQQSSNHWEFLSSDRDAAIQTILSRKNSTVSGLNVSVNMADNAHTLLLNGGTNINGSLDVTKGQVLLSGKPTPRAFDHQSRQEIVDDHNWINRHFIASSMTASNNASLSIGRNVSTVKSHFIGNDNAKLNFGASQHTPVCRYSDISGLTHCTESTGALDEFNHSPVTDIRGQISLHHQSQLNLGKAHLTGEIQGDSNTTVSVGKDATWTNTADSRLGNLDMQGGQINLNANTDGENIRQFNHLQIDGNLSGLGKFNYLTRGDLGKSDQVSIKGNTDGQFLLSVADKSTAPASVNELNLINLNERAQNNASFSLENGHVDMGAYRYVLVNDASKYRLYSPFRQQITDASYLTSKTLLEQQLENAIETAQAKQRSFEEAQTALNNMAATLNSKQQTVATAQASYDKLNNDLKATQQNRYLTTRAKNAAIQKIRTQLQTALSTLNAAKAELANTNIQNTNAQSNLASASSMVAQAQTEINQAQDAIANMKQTANNQVLAYCSEAGIDAQTCSSLGTISAEDGVDIAALDELSDELNALSNTLRSTQSMLDAKNIAHKDAISSVANTAVSGLSAQANMTLQTSRSIDREILKQSQSPFNVWVKHEYQETTHHADSFRNYEQDANLTQFGAEKALGNQWYVGGFISHLQADNKFSDRATGESKLNTLSLYAKTQSDNGIIGGVDISAGRFDGNLELKGDKAEFTQNMISIGTNIGKTYDLKGIQVQPSLGARIHHLASADYTLNGTTVTQPNMHFASARAGVEIAKDISIKGATIRPYINSEYQDAGLKDVAIKVDGENLNQTFDRHWQNEVGVAVKANAWELKANVGLTKGEQVDEQKYAAIKVGYEW